MSAPSRRAALLALLASLPLVPPPAAAAAAHSGHRPAPKRPHRRAAAAKSERPNSGPTDGPAYGRSPAVLALARQIAEQQALDADTVATTLAQARRQAVVARLIMPAASPAAKNWAAYRARFIEPERIRAGLAFWQAQADWLDAAQTRYGVPAEVVVGIIGVETFYGRVTGNFRVLDALATLSLDFPSGRSDRSPYFQQELGEFLALAQRQGDDPLAIKGSFAGAMGLGQFMPSSIRRWAVDFDGDGRIDMASSPTDVIGSVAHYLQAHGWQAGQATHFAVQPPADEAQRAPLLAPDILPSFSPAQMAAAGAQLDAAALAHPGPLALVELRNGDAAPSHVAGTQNFYAITRYNWSAYYAMAVIELGQAVAAARRAKP